MINTKAKKSQLEARRQELLQRMFAVESELDSHSSKDWEDLASEREDDEVLEQMGHAAKAEVAKIDAALARMAAGEYGYCARCGLEIAAERLDILPFTPFCSGCAR